MAPFNFCGPSYASQSPNLAALLTMNWFPESSEGQGQSPIALYPTPGLEVFCDLANTPIRGEITVNDRTFVVAGSRFYEIFSDGTFTLYGTVLNDSKPVSMAGGSSQLLLASAGMVYVFDFSTGHISTTALNQGGNNGIFTSALNAGGTGYVGGDTFTVAAGNMDATGIVDTVGGGGTVTAYHITSVGTNYAVNVGTPTTATTGAGTGLTIDITVLGGGYAVGDTGTIKGGTTAATYLVVTIDATGNVLTYTIPSGGAGYVVQNNVMTATGGAQPGIGAGFTIDISAVSVTNTFNPLPNGTLLGPISYVAYIQSFFVALLSSSNQFQWSSPLDATTWDPLDTAKVSVFAGNVLSMFADHNELWFWGERQTQPYYLSGSINVFDTIPGGFMEAGIFAPNSPVRLDNSIFWLGGDERGAGVVWRANGYTPSRVSNHAIEFALQGYLTRYGPTGLSDAVGYSYQDQGHGFYVLYFPTANATWVYDVSTGMWHQRGYWNAATAKFTAHRSQNHTFNFGKHLVGDWASGKVYNMNIALLDDAGNPIRRVRRAPHVAKEQKWAFHSQLQVFLESGLGPQPPLTSPAGPSGTHIQLPAQVGVVSQLVFRVGPSVAGHVYAFSIEVTNNEATDIKVGTGLISIGSEVIITPGSTRLVTNTVVGDGVLDAFIVIYNNGSTTNLAVDFNAINPSITDLNTGVNLIPLADQDFSSGWVSSTSPAVITQLIGTLPRDPMINLRWSDDSGHTWSNEYSVGAGQAGEYKKRVVWRRLGRSRDRIYEVSVSDPIPWRLIDAYLEASIGTGS